MDSLERVESAPPMASPASFSSSPSTSSSSFASSQEFKVNKVLATPAVRKMAMDYKVRHIRKIQTNREIIFEIFE